MRATFLVAESESVTPDRCVSSSAVGLLYINSKFEMEIRLYGYNPYEKNGQSPSVKPRTTKRSIHNYHTALNRRAAGRGKHGTAESKQKERRGRIHILTRRGGVARRQKPTNTHEPTMYLREHVPTGPLYPRTGEQVARAKNNRLL